MSICVLDFCGCVHQQAEFSPNGKIIAVAASTEQVSMWADYENGQLTFGGILYKIPPTSFTDVPTDDQVWEHINQHVGQSLYVYTNQVLSEEENNPDI